MRYIRLYRFSPKSQPPSKIQLMYPWFKDEVANASIEPYDTYEISDKGPVKGSAKNRPLAKTLFTAMLHLKKAFVALKKRLQW